MEASARKVSGIPARAVGYVYGNEGELRHMTGDADSTEVFYDCLYRPYQVWDGPDRINWYSYDLAGCPTEMDYPKSSDGNGGLVGNAVHFTTYNDAGELIESVDPNGVARDYVRNDGGLITDIIPSSGPGVHISYDGVSWRVSSASRNGVAQKDYAYYSSGLLKSATTTFADLADRSYAITCDYWDDGSLKGLALSANGQPALSYAYEYDTFGRIIKVSRYDGSNALQESTSWVYVGDTGLIDTQTVADGSNATIDKTIYYYGPMGILTGQVNKNGSDAVLSSFSAMAYDAVGNLTGMSTTVPNTTGLSGLTSYIYDHLDRLTSETSARGGNYSETFDYDAFHNLTTFRGASRDFNVNNQDTSFAFTSNGDPTEYGANVVPGWDVDDNLVSYTIGSSTVMTADYGPDGLRAWKQTGESSTRRYFVYFAGVPICELNASGYIIATNTFGPTGLVSRHEYTVNSNGGVTGSQHFYYTFDPLGHVCQIQNAGGTVIASLAYDAYGQPISGSGTNPTPYGYGGQAGYYTDPETNLILCSLRYYDPSTGRWLNRDPIGYGGGRNVYAYCGGNPVGRLDAWGLMSLSELWEKIKEGASAAGEYVYNLPSTAVKYAASGTTFTGPTLQDAGRGNEELFDIDGVAEYHGAIHEAGHAVCDFTNKATNDFAWAAAGPVTEKLGEVAEICAPEYAAAEDSYGLCFLGGTLVATANGSVPIENLRAGQNVWSYDWSAAIDADRPGANDSVQVLDDDMKVVGQGVLHDLKPGARVCFGNRVYDVAGSGPLVDTGVVSSRIARTFARQVDTVVNLTVRSAGGKVCVISATPGHPFYVPAVRGYVAAGVLAPNTELRTTDGDSANLLSSATRHGSFAVYNFEVEGEHNYYVSADRVLVHNECGPAIRNGKLAGGVHPETGVPFDGDGFPMFDSEIDVKIEATGNYAADARAANRAAGYAETPDGYVWHHHQDGETMQLVDQWIHMKTGHTGGMAFVK